MSELRSAKLHAAAAAARHAALAGLNDTCDRLETSLKENVVGLRALDGNMRGGLMAAAERVCALEATLEMEGASRARGRGAG